MKQIILGTAGHIDHGKTSLIKALTGTDTDRLKEEKQRGITIELGFAELTLPGGQHVGIVDVPGHEKFVKNMVAGATGIDIVAMVIAADEGVMPQTKEHLEICSLLDIKHGLVVLTKTDMVDEEWLELVTEDVREYMEGTFLEGAEILPVSSTTGKGIPELKEFLSTACKEIPERKTSSLFRLPVDRVFTMKGFGTVITGTVASGNIKVGSDIMVYPSGIESKVRGIQVHGQGVDEAGSGMRTAINFQGLDLESVNRGEVVSLPGMLKPSFLIDGSMKYLESNGKPIKNRARVRFHTGTNEAIGHLILLDREELHPGDSAVVQLRLDTPIVSIKDDNFVIRSYSPVRTIAGGRILNPAPRKHKRFREDIISGLTSLTGDNTEEIISFFVLQGGFEGTQYKDLKIMSNTGEKVLKKAIGALQARRDVILVDKESQSFVHKSFFDKLIETCTENLESYHKANPLKENMSKEEFKSKLPSAVGIKLFNLIVNQMIKDKTIVQDENAIRLSSHRVALQFDQEEMKGKILDIYSRSGVTPPYFKAVVSDTLKIDTKSAMDVLSILVSEGKIIKVKEDLYYSAKALEETREKLVDFLTEHGEITTPQFKDMLGISRKYIISLIEHFDNINLTIRVGDTRQLRGGKK